MADPLFSTNLSVTLVKLADLIMDKFWAIERGAGVDEYLITPKKVTLLPSYFYWFPSLERLELSGLLMRNLEALRKQESEENFPLLGVAGRGVREIVTLGGGVSLNINFRVYLLVAVPPSLDVLEKIGVTLGHISRIILAHIHYPPYWWFAQINEEEVVQRSDLGGLGVSAGFIGGTLRGMPHVVPLTFTTP